MPEREKLLHSLFNIDSVFDFLLSIGVKPFAELSFMPSTLASSNTTALSVDASALRPEPHPLRFAEGSLEFDLVMRPQSVAAVRIEFTAA